MYDFDKRLAERGREYDLKLREINNRYRNVKKNGVWYKPKSRYLKLELLAEFKYCFWCGIPVRDFVIPDGERAPSDMATLDHVVSRFTRKKGDWVLKVLSCEHCNSDRSFIEQKEQQRIKLSTRYPHMKRE